MPVDPPPAPPRPPWACACACACALRPRDRERAEMELRAALRKEWQLGQETVKSEPLAITYSYWNGTGHR
jgi:hypothetical protein